MCKATHVDNLFPSDFYLLPEAGVVFVLMNTTKHFYFKERGKCPQNMSVKCSSGIPLLQTFFHSSHHSVRATELLRQPALASFSQTGVTSLKKNQNGNVLLPRRVLQNTYWRGWSPQYVKRRSLQDHPSGGMECLMVQSATLWSLLIKARLS